MTEDKKPENAEGKQSNNKMIIIAVVAVAAVVIVGALAVSQSKDETVSMKVGDKEFSATINR